MRFRQMEFDFQKYTATAKQAEENSLLGRTKKFSLAMKSIFPDMPKDSAKLPAYFESVENLFKLYKNAGYASVIVCRLHRSNVVHRQENI